MSGKEVKELAAIIAQNQIHIACLIEAVKLKIGIPANHQILSATAAQHISVAESAKVCEPISESIIIDQKVDSSIECKSESISIKGGETPIREPESKTQNCVPVPADKMSAMVSHQQYEDSNKIL